MHRISVFVSRILAVFALFALQGAAAQSWPAQPIHLVTAFAAGSSADFVARLFSEQLAQALGQPVIVEYKPGAGGSLGTDLVAKSKPDGYTLLLATNAPMTTTPKLYPKTAYDPLRDFAPVILLCVTPQMLVVAVHSPITSVAQLLTEARSRNGKLNYGTSGNGSVSHLSMELIKSTKGIEAQHIPYPASPQVVTALLGGTIDLGVIAPVAIMPQVKAGKLRPLAVTSKARNSSLPDVPTVAESGFPGLDAIGWFAVVAPAGTPAPIVERLNLEIARIIVQPEVREKLRTQFFDPAPTNPGAVTEQIRADTQRWGALIDQLGIKAD